VTTVAAQTPKRDRGAQPGHRENIADRQARAINLRRDGATYMD
jgi:hypothetical protein